MTFNLQDFGACSSRAIYMHRFADGNSNDAK